MSSLRRLLSLECADSISLPVQSPTKRVLARHRSLPARSFSRPKGLPSLSPPTSRFCRSGRSKPGPFYCAHREVNPSQKFASFQSIPTWSLDDELDGGVHTATWPVSKKENSGMQDSVVYKELSDAIRCLEAPPKYAQVLSSEGALGLVQTDADAPLCEEEKKTMEPLGIDVRGRPMSLRMLKRKASAKGGLSSDVKQGLPRELSMMGKMGGSVDSAFSSLVFMMESLQQHTIWLRKVLMSEADARLHVMLLKVQQEMQDTFLWLFQKVFACTPKLMLLTMMLLTDFAVHSMGDHVALGVMPMGEPPTCGIERTMSAPSLGSVSTETKGHKILASLLKEVAGGPRLCAGGAGDKVARTLMVGGSMDGEALPITSVDRAAITAEDDSHGGLSDAPYQGRYPLLESKGIGEDQHKFSTLWQQAVLKEQNLRPLVQTGHLLVAPVQAPELEADNYPCFDRTDLNYQHELSRDPSNPLLLANYAQFLHVVRHDHDRADELYKRAVKADPIDGEVIGKYANFLWVAKEDVEAADEAYKAALAVDPSNVYHAGSYANFLWNSPSGPEDTAPIITPYQQVSTT